jgi:GNAT superfamily N-acetyltransferase
MRSNDFDPSPFLSRHFIERLKATIPISQGLVAEIEDERHFVRRLWPSDQGAFLNHLLRLDPESRHDRFAMGVSDEFIARYAERCFEADGLIFGYFAEDELRGAGELRMTSRDHKTAEAAFSVEKDWRRKGVGKALMTRIVRGARNEGVTTLYLTCLASNRAMQKVARHFDAELKFETDQVTGRLVGYARTSGPTLEDHLDDAASLATSIIEKLRRDGKEQ